MPALIHPENNTDDSWHEGGAWSREWAARRRINQFEPKPEPPPYEHQEYPKVVKHAAGHHATVHSKEEEDQFLGSSDAPGHDAATLNDVQPLASHVEYVEKPYIPSQAAMSEEAAIEAPRAGEAPVVINEPIKESDAEKN